MLACAGTWLGVASESLECGVARLNERKYDEAARAFEQAVRLARDRQDVARPATYWLGESYWQLGRIEQADQAFTRLAQSPGRDGFDVWALANSGWTALRLGDFARARETFTRLLAARPTYPLDAYGRFGLALSLYALGQYEDAQRAWREVTAQRLPAPLARDAAFWSGETLARLKQYDRASTELGRFVAGWPPSAAGLGSDAARLVAARRGQVRAGRGAAARSAAAARRPQRARRAGLEGLPASRWPCSGAKDLDGARNAARPLAQRGSKLSSLSTSSVLEALVAARRGPGRRRARAATAGGRPSSPTRGAWCSC